MPLKLKPEDLAQWTRRREIYDFAVDQARLLESEFKIWSAQLRERYGISEQLLFDIVPQSGEIKFRINGTCPVHKKYKPEKRPRTKCPACRQLFENAEQQRKAKAKGKTDG